MQSREGRERVVRGREEDRDPDNVIDGAERLGYREEKPRNRPWRRQAERRPRWNWKASTGEEENPLWRGGGSGHQPSSAGRMQPVRIKDQEIVDTDRQNAGEQRGGGSHQVPHRMAISDDATQRIGGSHENDLLHVLRRVTPTRDVWENHI